MPVIPNTTPLPLEHQSGNINIRPIFDFVRYDLERILGIITTNKIEQVVDTREVQTVFEYISQVVFRTSISQLTENIQGNTKELTADILGWVSNYVNNSINTAKKNIIEEVEKMIKESKDVK